MDNIITLPVATDAAPLPPGNILTLAEALDLVVTTLKRFVHFAKPEQTIAVALWIAHTYLIDNFRVTPRLAIRAPSKQSGKSRLMEVTRELTANSWYVIGPSAAVLFRKIERDQPTILLDEADRLFEKRAEDTADVLQVLNAGHTQGAVVPRVIGPKHDLKDFAVYAALAVAGIGTNWPDTLLDRSIVINMEKKKASEKVERLRDADFPKIRAVAPQLAHALTGVTSFTVEPDLLPTELSDRAQDSWEPLIAIADAAGPEWAANARHAALSLMNDGSQGSEERKELLLLKDIRAIFEDDKNPDYLSSKYLLARLLPMAESPWNEHPILTQRGMASQLGLFGIKPTIVERGVRGYFLAAIERHWDRLGNPNESLEGLVQPLDLEADDEAA